MTGRRLPDGTRPTQPGEYAWMPYALWPHVPRFFDGEGEWHLIGPDGRAGAVRTERGKPPTHAVEVHADDTITVRPSLVMPSGWHGFLTRGEWSSC